jgi:DNA (cytosine-5)-methyltransferase 1
MAGGPPCQSFSSAGRQRGLDDPRGRLFEHFVRLAAALRPRFILFENVRGLITARGPKGQPGEVIGLVRAGFESIGYATNFALLNAADYGCHQRRVRCFMLATRQSPLPDFPTATHSESPTLYQAAWRPLREVLLRFEGCLTDADVVRPSPTLAARLASVAVGSGLKSPGAREATRPGGHWGYKQGTFIADPLQPARTVTAATAQDWIRSADGSLRRLSWKECAALQGFPEDWEFSGSAASVLRQIGNAVPSVFGMVLGRAVLTALASYDDNGTADSAPFPGSFKVAIQYTKRDHARNGASRQWSRLMQRTTQFDTARFKGTGSAETASKEAVS